MKFYLAVALIGLAGCGQTPQPRDAQANSLVKEQAELHMLLAKTRPPVPAKRP